MISIDSQAPSVNFERITTTRTIPVVVAPTILIAIERRQPLLASVPFRRSDNQCRTMPVCERVNEVNTPTT